MLLDTSGYDEASTPSQAGIVLEADPSPWNDQQWSVTVRVARLSTLYLAPMGKVLEAGGLTSPDPVRT